MKVRKEAAYVISKVVEQLSVIVEKSRFQQQLV